jgi:hypothetical protein
MYSKYVSVTERKKAKQEILLTLKGAAQGSKDLFIQGLQEVNKNKVQAFLIRMTANTFLKSGLYKPFLYAVYHLNKIRKRVFKK